MSLRSPTLRLTLAYVAIIMCLSLAFSVALYDIATRQVAGGLRHQVQVFYGRRMPLTLPFDPFNEELLEAQAHEIQERVRTSLIVINGVILLAAGGVSYLLARRTLRPIEESLAAQRRFTSDASHELRTPLTAMRTEIEVALRNKTLGCDEHLKVMRSALEEIQRLERLSRGLLRLAQSEERELPVSAAVQPVELLTKKAVKDVTPSAKAKRISFEYGGLEGSVQGEHDSLVELFIILLDNAVKYSPANTTVNVRSRVLGNRVVIRVEDRGIGIAPTDLPHIFERFYRADRSRSKSAADGYGLGLPIAKHIVEQHHGSIDVKSDIGAGTVVSVFLPRAAS